MQNRLQGLTGAQYLNLTAQILHPYSPICPLYSPKIIIWSDLLPRFCDFFFWKLFSTMEID